MCLKLLFSKIVDFASFAIIDSTQPLVVHASVPKQITASNVSYTDTSSFPEAVRSSTITREELWSRSRVVVPMELSHRLCEHYVARSYGSRLQTNHKTRIYLKSTYFKTRFVRVCQRTLERKHSWWFHNLDLSARAGAALTNYRLARPRDTSSILTLAQQQD